jgi:hypothetical protein
MKVEKATFDIAKSSLRSVDSHTLGRPNIAFLSIWAFSTFIQ